MRLIVYSHDSFGIGNIRRMLAICKYLINNIPGASILILSGSPIIHSFRMQPGLDYIKLPYLGRDQVGQIGAQYLSTEVDETLRLRSNLIKTAVTYFKPDLFLVDKRPYGLLRELKSTLDYLKVFSPKTKLVLLLRDILDTPQVTIRDWQKHGAYQVIESLYDKVLIVGMPEIFDLIQEYRFPNKIAKKVRYCGYIRRQPGYKQANLVRKELNIRSGKKLVLVTPGGGGDGYRLVHNYLLGLSHLPTKHKINSLIVYGSEMPLSQRQELEKSARRSPHIQTMEFSSDLANYITAADTVVSMGGYNTICEILSLGKRAVVVPRNKPVEEQLIRAQKMSELGLFKLVHPGNLTPQNLIETVLEQLKSKNNHLSAISSLNWNALPCIKQEILTLLSNEILSHSVSPHRELEVRSSGSDFAQDEALLLSGSPT